MNDEYTHESTAQGEIAPAGWPKPIGVLSLVFGILAVTCGVVGMAMWAASDALMGSLMGGAMPPNTPPPPFSPPMSPVLLTSAGLGVILNIILICAGAALLKRSESGRSLHLVYALVGIVAAFFGSFAGYSGQQAQQQAMTQWIEQHGDTDDTTRQIADSQKQSAQMQGPIQAVSLIVGLIVALAWPVFCIVWFGMMKKAVPPAYEF